MMICRSFGLSREFFVMRIITILHAFRRCLPVGAVMYVLCARTGMDSGDILLNVFLMSSFVTFALYGAVDFTELKKLGKNGLADEKIRLHSDLTMIAWDNRKKDPPSFWHGVKMGLSIGLLTLAEVFVIDWWLKLLVYDFFTGEARIVEAWYYVLDFIDGVFLTLGGGVSV